MPNQLQRLVSILEGKVPDETNPAEMMLGDAEPQPRSTTSGDRMGTDEDDEKKRKAQAEPQPRSTTSGDRRGGMDR